MPTAQTIQYNDDGSIDRIEREVEDPGQGQVQIEGGACGICSWDVATARYGSEMKPMAKPGHEGVGYVAKIGPGVTGFQEGDRVAGGGFSTVRNLQAERAYPIPESDLPDEYWIVEPVACVVTGVDHCQIKPGDRIAVVGCGFMGQMILQVLVRHPLDELVAIDIDQRRLTSRSYHLTTPRSHYLTISPSHYLTISPPHHLTTQPYDPPQA